MTSRSAESIFTRIYERREWGGESASGPGSGLVRTAELRDDLGQLLTRLAVRSILDAGCGDFHWMKELPLPGISYIGVDVVPPLVERAQSAYASPAREFFLIDVRRDTLPRVDVILCRDVLPHFSNDDIQAALANFGRSGSTWLLATTFVGPRVNEDIETGDWRPINLEAPPFDLAEPSALIDERCLHSGGIWADKRLALWALPVARRLATSG